MGLAIAVAGHATDRRGVFRLGAGIAAPGLGFLIWLAFVLTLAAVVNLVACARGAIRRRVDRGAKRP